MVYPNHYYIKHNPPASQTLGNSHGTMAGAQEVHGIPIAIRTNQQRRHLERFLRCWFFLSPEQLVVQQEGQILHGWNGKGRFGQLMARSGCRGTSLTVPPIPQVSVVEHDSFQRWRNTHCRQIDRSELIVGDETQVKYWSKSVSLHFFETPRQVENNCYYIQSTSTLLP